MSRTIIPQALWRGKRESCGPPGPGWRRIDGRWFYSSAWLDEGERRSEEETTQ